MTSALYPAMLPRPTHDLAVYDAAESFLNFSTRLCTDLRSTDTNLFEYLSDFMIAWLLLDDGVDRSRGDDAYANYAMAMALVRDGVIAEDPGIPRHPAFRRKALVEAHRNRIPPIGVGPRTYDRWAVATTEQRNALAVEYAADCWVLRSAFGW